MSWWTMTGLGTAGRPWSMEERFERIAEAGYDGINGFLPGPEEAEEWDRLLAQYNLSFSVNAYPRTAEDMQQFLADAKAFGADRLHYVNAQVLAPFLVGERAEQLLRDISGLSAEAGIPVFIETHRGTITQDLIRTAEMVRALEPAKLTIDFSHYVLAGEMLQISEDAEALFQQLLKRTGCIHARVSNGEQIQVDVGSEQGEHPMLVHYKRWWKDGMRHWLIGAALGQKLPFVCELGPAPYAITSDEAGGRKTEMSDRWTQSLVLQKLARELWAEIH
ncbi:TIM barrel protein [Paenibacillus sp. NEAU-GSW1]|nr:TIM barrel protein [Paenibacillus sp. NEAU-GSW1]